MLLCLSLTLTVSGAWFTDSSSDTSDNSVSLKFGKVVAGNVNVATGITNLKPGQEIEYSGNGTSGAIEYNGNVAAYYRLSLSATNSMGTYLTFAEKASGQFQDANYIYGSVAANGTIPKGTVIFSDSAINSLQGVAFALTVKIELIQEAHINSTNVSNTGNMTTLENYQALFNAVTVE